MKFLLDTNFCIACLRGGKVALQKLGERVPDDCGVSTISVYELHSGVVRCRDPEREGRKVEAFIEPLHVLPFDLEAARRSAIVRWDLERSGTPIGPYDLQLAGHALALNVTLVSRNVREFSRVHGLQIENWEGSGEG